MTVDYNILEKGCSKNSKALKLAKNQERNMDLGIKQPENKNINIVYEGTNSKV